jgi:allophanate hydrolase
MGPGDKSQPLSLDMASLRQAYAAGDLSPERLVREVLERIAATREANAWIEVVPEDRLRDWARDLDGRDPQALPLYGVPFAIKDNIDLAGMPTTAACPAYAYTPDRSAFVVQQLIDAGAIPVGKTNLDQFATGLVGTRTPYGPTRNAFDPDYIAGGSSSGSAVAVAQGCVSFALGTDTAGSGRVPAAFNNLVGLKPTPGLVSNRGVVPACQSLDCVSVFALSADDANRVFDVVAAFDPDDPYARPNPAFNTGTAYGTAPRAPLRFGVPRDRDLAFFGDSAYEALFTRAVDALVQLGGEPVQLDFGPFFEAARLLYEGPWVAERYAAIGKFLESAPNALHPVTRSIIAPGAQPSAAALFAAQHRLAALKRTTDAALTGLDCVLTPTTGTVYRIEEVLARPFELNARLGRYTNFMNLLDLAAVAVPVGFTPAGFPFGITLFAPAFSDKALLNLARDLQQALGLALGATGAPLPPSEAGERFSPGTLKLVVCGAHMSGLALNHQLTERGGRLLRRTRTASCYRLYALPGEPPARPGLVRVTSEGATIEVEVWELPEALLGSFVRLIPPPLGIGRIALEDGTSELGFLCEAYGVADAEDITACGGWRGFLGR